MTGPTNKSRQRKQKILKTAQELFNSKGFQDTSVDDIMKKVGAAKGVFYYYFETKEQILDALIEENVNFTLKAVAPIVEKSGLNAFQKLQLILQEEFKASMENYDPDNHVHNIKNVDMHQKILTCMVVRFAPIIAKIVEQGIGEGLFKTEYPLEVSEIIVAGIKFVTDLGIFKWSKEQYLRKVRASEELMEKALCIEKGSFEFLSRLLKGVPDIVNSNKQV